MKKFNKSVQVIYLLSLLIVGNMAILKTEGASTSLDTRTTVRFIQDENSEGEIEPPVLPEEGGVIDPEIGGIQPAEKLPLMINFAPNFEFGEVPIQAKSIKVPAISEIKTSEGAPVAHFIQVLDNRGTHDGWELSLTTTDFNVMEKSEETRLVETFISLSDVTVSGLSDGKASAESNQVIKFPQKDVSIMKASANAGEGSWVAKFGSKNTLKTKDNQLLNDAVTLNISEKDMTKVSAADYVATLTWNLVGNIDFTKSAIPQT